MNTSSNLTVVHNAEESVVNFEGEIGEIRMDGKRLSDIHDLTRKVEGVAQSIKTLVLCLGAIVMICLICNVAMATWVAKYDSDIRGTINAQQSEIENLSHSKGLMGEKLKSLGWVWDARTRDWQHFGNNPVNPTK
jgi:hypothetical protein